VNQEDNDELEFQARERAREIAEIEARGARCRECGYLLVGLPDAERCPECGTLLPPPGTSILPYDPRHYADYGNRVGWILGGPVAVVTLIVMAVSLRVGSILGVLTFAALMSFGIGLLIVRGQFDEDWGRAIGWSASFTLAPFWALIILSRLF
jgi:hypothetical protein